MEAQEGTCSRGVRLNGAVEHKIFRNSIKLRDICDSAIAEQ